MPTPNYSDRNYLGIRWLATMTLLLVSTCAHALDSATATIQIQCKGNSDARVAIRWGHPKYDGTADMSLWSVRCDDSQATQETTKQNQVTIKERDSQFEIQTEGGILTGYDINVQIVGGNTKLGGIDISHQGSPTLAVSGSGFHIQRSSGPNRYGEQNFRVYLDSTKTANVKMLAQVTGDSSKAQMAIRWGHTDFNNNPYFPLWTIKPGDSSPKQFILGNNASEFEIQTEGGEKTAYQLSIWLDQGRGFPVQPSIYITHQTAPALVTIYKDSENIFNASTGNIYGELDTYVSIAELPKVAATPPSTVTQSGWTGEVFLCNPTLSNTQEYLHIQATIPAPAKPTGKTSMAEDNISLSFPPGGVAGSSQSFSTQQDYQPGTWTITNVYLTPTPTTGAEPKNAAKIPVLPQPITLPSTVGQPVLDFRGPPGATCPTQ